MLKLCYIFLFCLSTSVPFWSIKVFLVTLSTLSTAYKILFAVMLTDNPSLRPPPPVHQEPHRPWSPSVADSLNGKRPRDDGLVPLVIPVSVPVRRQDPSAPDHDDAAPASCWSSRLSNPQEPGRDDHKPSVIVARRRSLRNSASESPDQVRLSSSRFCFFPCLKNTL